MNLATLAEARTRIEWPPQLEELTLCDPTLCQGALTRRPAIMPDVPDDLVPGDRIAGAPYVIVRRLGQGGMGEVYEVEHITLGRRAAVKVLHRRHFGRVDLAGRMRVEARALARLRHPNLVEVFDLGATTDGRPWFAMPLLEGRDLHDALARTGRMSMAAAAGLSLQALAGLAAAHAAGIVHRDVKLENLFLETDGTLKVLDFGVARVVDRARDADARVTTARTGAGVSLGTPRWMAPEQCVCGPVDARTDLYAVGLVLYELATGRGPFDDVRGSEHALRYAHCTRMPAAPSSLAPLPSAFDAIVLRALAKDPSDRFGCAAEMELALRRLLSPASDARPRLPVGPSERLFARRGAPVRFRRRGL